MYKNFPKICVLRTKLNWITQKQNQQKTMIFKKIHLSIFQKKKNTCIIGMAIILFYQIFFKSFCNGNPFELLYLLKIMKIIVVIRDNSCPMTQVLIFFFYFCMAYSVFYLLQALCTHPLSTPRIKFMTKNAPSTTMETKQINCHELPIASWT